jgi:SAM-dependent methyltransferase
MPVPLSQELRELYGLLGEVPSQPFTESFVRSVAAIEDYGVEWTVELAHELGIAAALEGAQATSQQLIEQLGFSVAFRPALDWLLTRLVTAGLLEADDVTGQRCYALSSQLRGSQRESLRRDSLAMAASNAAALDLLDAAGSAYPAVARGEITGRQALLGPQRIPMWATYFHNDNPVYAINNTIAAVAVANRLPESGARLLEVGAGGGSASQATLALLAERDQLGRLAAYRITEPSPFFRRRAQRELTTGYPQLPLSFAELDIDRPWAEQGIEPGSLDVVFGANVIHVAHDLAFSLCEAHRALASGGWLIAEECLRPQPDEAISIEMVFQLLGSFTDVKVDPEIRPNPGFLTIPQWRKAIAAAGFDRLEVVPELERIVDRFPLFFSGALCAQKTDGALKPAGAQA